MIVSCDVHGPMKRREHLCWWECLGFDGEGCDAWLTDTDISAGISERGVQVVYDEDIRRGAGSGIPGVTVTP